MKKNVQNLSSGKTGHKPVIRDIYDCLLDLHGHQGWWPLTGLHETGGINPTKTGSVKGYHPADDTYPQTRDQQFEIICGALLTQNTSWIQVEKALLNLKQLNASSPRSRYSPWPGNFKRSNQASRLLQPESNTPRNSCQLVSGTEG